MSALVGYESSDDEHDVTAVESATTTTSDATGNKSTHEASDVRDGNSAGGLERKATSVETTTAVGNAPMLGPVMPEQASSEVEQAPLSELRESMSDRDIIHHLTAAPHPMTSLPSSPPGSPDPALDAKFKRFLELKAKGVHFNVDLASKTPFRNPTLLSTLMDRAGLEGDDQYQTSLPREIWDPSGFPPSAYKEALLESQQKLKEKELATKKTLASGKRTIDFRSGGISGNTSTESTPETPNKRKRPSDR